jgi:hypothetical protein
VISQYGKIQHPISTRSRIRAVRDTITKEVVQFGDLRLQGTQEFITQADTLKGNKPELDTTLVSTSEIKKANAIMKMALALTKRYFEASASEQTIEYKQIVVGLQLQPLASEQPTIGNTRLNRRRRVNDLATLQRFVRLYATTTTLKPWILQAVEKEWLITHCTRLLQWFNIQPT